MQTYRTRLALSGADWHLPAGSVSTGTEQAAGFTWVVFPAEPMPVWFEAEAVQSDKITFEQVVKAADVVKHDYYRQYSYHMLETMRVITAGGKTWLKTKNGWERIYPLVA